MNRDIPIHQLREDYRKGALLEAEMHPNPLKKFELWFKQALETGVDEPNAMCLSTCTKDLKPKSRIVLLKDLDQGFVFYTNYNSNKGQELLANPNAALNFVWLPLERQVRIEGSVELVNEEEAITYFNSRPLGSKLGALASNQSQVIADRSILENELASLKLKYDENNHPLKPKHWGGFRLIPELIEFWHGRSSRLHDRIRYQLAENNEWCMERLAP